MLIGIASTPHWLPACVPSADTGIAAGLSFSANITAKFNNVRF